MHQEFDALLKVLGQIRRLSNLIPSDYGIEAQRIRETAAPDDRPERNGSVRLTVTLDRDGIAKALDNEGGDALAVLLGEQRGE
ncbi:MAG: hypothetical protein OXC11_10420 [Rhodospirillales bacterium]|nr:hypothetical protein [Rhodospirillales bacterium]